MSADGDTLLDSTRAEATDFYERDFHAWLIAQAATLRGTGTMPLDLDNLAEEIEALAGRERREIRKHLTTLLEHLLKHAHGKQRDPARGGHNTISRERDDIADMVKQSPSLRRVVDEAFEDAYTRARRNALLSFAEHEPETDGYAAAIPPEPSFSLEETLDHDYLP